MLILLSQSDMGIQYFIPGFLEAVRLYALLTWVDVHRTFTVPVAWQVRFVPDQDCDEVLSHVL